MYLLMCFGADVSQIQPPVNISRSNNMMSGTSQPLCLVAENQLSAYKVMSELVIHAITSQHIGLFSSVQHLHSNCVCYFTVSCFHLSVNSPVSNHYTSSFYLLSVQWLVTYQCQSHVFLHLVRSCAYTHELVYMHIYVCVYVVCLCVYFFICKHPGMHVDI